MPGTIRQVFLQSSLFFLLLLPGLVSAGQSAPGEDLASEPMLLEVRYCECKATERQSSPAELLPAFLEASSSLKVGVTPEDEGVVASDAFSLKYRVSPVEDDSGTFKLTYASAYTPGGSSNRSQAEVVLIKGEWVQLFGSYHESDSGTRHIGVAVRLVESSKD